MLSCLKSLIHANNSAVAPKNIAHGNTKETPDVNPNFKDDATNVIIASPNNPNADGLSSNYFYLFCVFHTLLLSNHYYDLIKVIRN